MRRSLVRWWWRSWATALGLSDAAFANNDANLTLLSNAALRGQIAAGKIKPLAVTGAPRLPGIPDVPTVAGSGFPGFEAYSWIGLFVPAATPPAIARQLTDDFQATLNRLQRTGLAGAARR